MQTTPFANYAAEHFLWECEGGIATITLNRPERKNPLTFESYAELRDLFRSLVYADDVHTVVVRGAGGNFCAGVDLASFGEGGSDGEHPFGRCARAVAGFGKPWIGAAAGVAVGGGATILFHADICYVGESLRMRLPFAALGLPPEFASSYMLQANIGAQRAAELFYTAEWVDADKALHCGIAADVLPDSQLFDHAFAKAVEIAQWPVNALREIKRTLRLHHLPAIDAAINAEQAAMERQAGSPENIEAITAFMEKRKPDFRNL